MSRSSRIIVVALVLAASAFIVLSRRGDGHAPPAENGRAAVGMERASTGDLPLPKLLDLGSTTCIPCKKMEPILEDLAERYRGELVVEFIDIRADRSAAQRYGIRLIPTQIFLDREGRELFRHEGFMAGEDILAKWRELGIELDGADQGRG